MEREELQVLWDKFAAEEDELIFPHFCRADAWDLGMALHEHSEKLGIPLSIQITINELPVFRYIPDGVTKNNLRWLERKHNMVMVREMSSRRAEIMLKMQGKTVADWFLDPEKYAGMGGGFPVRVEGTGIIGSVCVSGPPAEQDHEIIVEVIRNYLK